jgi:DNA modification methylase
MPPLPPPLLVHHRTRHRLPRPREAMREMLSVILMILLVNGDALRIPLADESVDCVVTSPPYGELRDYEGYHYEFAPIAKEIVRVLKPGRVLVWVEGDETNGTGESGDSFRHALAFKDLGLRLHDTMIYMKSGPSYPSQDKYYQVFEYMFILSKGRPAVFNPLKDRENRWFGQKWSKVRTRREKNGDLKSQIWYADEVEKMGVRFNIWQYAVGHGYHGDEFCHEHPATFPEALAQDHILSWTNPGDTVLDPMCGSGTTLKMAELNNRNAIGIDCSLKYCNLSRRRIERTTAQMGMAW